MRWRGGAQQGHPTQAANLQLSSHHPMGKSAFLNISNPDGSLTGTSTPHRQVVHTTRVCAFCRLLLETAQVQRLGKSLE